MQHYWKNINIKFAAISILGAIFPSGPILSFRADFFYLPRRTVLAPSRLGRTWPPAWEDILLPRRLLTGGTPVRLGRLFLPAWKCLFSSSAHPFKTRNFTPILSLSSSRYFSLTLLSSPRSLSCLRAGRRLQILCFFANTNLFRGTVQQYWSHIIFLWKRFTLKTMTWSYWWSLLDMVARSIV